MPGFGQSPENTRTGTSDELGATMLAATTAPKPRLATKPGRARKARRTDAKKHHGRIKKDRAKPAWD